MTEIPQALSMTPETAFARLQAWYIARDNLQSLRASEVLERSALCTYYFPNPKEGSNRLALGGGFDLKMTLKVTRSVDDAAFDNLDRTAAAKLGINVDTLFVMRPKLVTSEYRKLTKAQRVFVDALLDIKHDGLPGLKVVPAGERDADDAEEQPAAEATAQPQFHIVTDVNDAYEGSHYTDGEGNWWQLVLKDGAGSWEEVEDADTVALLEAQVAMAEDPAPAPPAAPAKRTRRKRKGAAE